MSIHSAERCDGRRLSRGLTEAASWLSSQAAEINALNVFPVPDGDTGTNMSLTLLAAAEEAAATADSSAGAVARAAAHGALLGARGNSGVILSQFLRGLARHLEKHDDFDGRDLAQALQSASATAIKAVIRPVEGTMLTVGREAAQAAAARAEAGGDVLAVLEASVAAARASVARTPTLLPVLRQAGVVDAGGQGLLCIFEGLLRSLRGEPLVAAAPPAEAVRQPVLETDHFGYCTEFLLRGEGIDIEAVRARIASLGDSALVVGDSDLVRVHVHTPRPGQILEYACGLGTLHRIKIDNMQDQHDHLHVAPPKPAANGAGSLAPLPAEHQVGVNGHAAKQRLAMVAVAAGEGFAEVFRSLGVSSIVHGGQTMNPSTEELLRAVDSVAADRVLLLPNNSNILLAAGQVCGLTRKELAIIPAKDMAQGVAAALAFQPESDLDANVRAMERAMRSVRTGEITAAVRSARIDGFAIETGQFLGLVGGQLVAVGDDPTEVLGQMLGRMDAASSQVLTLYSGAGVALDQAEAIVGPIRADYPGLEVEILSGGQPLYEYVIALE